MKTWVKKAEQSLRESLFPVPVEKNELDWKEMLSEKSTRLAMDLSAMSFGILAETVSAGMMKPSDPESSSKKFKTYIPCRA